MKKPLYISLEFAIVVAICFAGDFIVSILPFKFSSSVLSMLILLILLMIKALKYEQIENISSFMLGNMAILFVPLGVSLLSYIDVIKSIFGVFVAVILLTTPIVYAATALTAQIIINTQNKKEEH